MIDFYTYPTPNGRKVSIALEEMGIPYTPVTIDINKEEQFAPEFLAISPNNKVPAIFDHVTGRSLMESGAILLYLAEKSGSLFPADRHWEAMEWLMFQVGGLGPMLGQAHHFLKFNAGKSLYSEQRYFLETERLYGVLDRRLAAEEYLIGDYSIADIACWPWIARFEWQRIDLLQFPNILRWYSKIADRPAVKRGYHVPHFVTEIPIAPSLSKFRPR